MNASCTAVQSDCGTGMRRSLSQSGLIPLPQAIHTPLSKLRNFSCTNLHRVTSQPSLQSLASGHGLLCNSRVLQLQRDTRASSWSGAAQHSTPDSHSQAQHRASTSHVHFTTATGTDASLAAKAQQKVVSHAMFASLTRVLLVGQPSALVRNIASRKWRAAGPVSLLLFLFGLVLAILTAVRTVLVRRVKSCKCCRGYGIVRCKLCNGQGSVEWMGKQAHQETCPLCMTKRFVTCPECGGHYHRKMFNHIKVATRGPVSDFLGA